MVKFLVGNNCSTNQSVTTKLETPLIGYARHWFDLAVGRFLVESEDLISQIQTLMLHLCLPNNAAQLAEHTDLVPVRGPA